MNLNKTIFLVTFFILTSCSYLWSSPTNIKNIASQNDLLAYALAHTTDIAFQEKLYMHTLDRYLESEEHAYALALFKSLRIENPELTKRLSQYYIVSFSHIKSVAHTWHFVQKFSKNLQPDLLSALIYESLAKNDVNTANIYLNKLKNPLYISRSAQVIASYYAKEGSIPNVKSLLPRIQLPSEKDSILLKLIKLLVNAKAYDEVSTFTSQLSRQELRDEAIIIVIKAHANEGNFDQAISHLSKLESSPYYDIGLLAIITAHTQRDNFATAIDYAASLRQPNNSYKALTAIAVRFAQFANTGGIEQAYSQLPEIPAIRLDFITQVSTELAVKGFIEQSLDYAFSLPVNDQATLIPHLAKQLGGLRDVHYNFLILQRIENIDVYNKSLGAFAENLAKNNNHRHALDALALIKSKNEKQDALSQAILFARTEKDIFAYFKQLNHSNKARFITSYIQQNQTTQSSAKTLAFIEKLTLKHSLKGPEAFTPLILKTRLYADISDARSARNELQLAGKLLSKNSFPINDDILENYIQLHVQYGDIKQAWKAITLNPNPKQAIFHTSLIPNPTSKSEKKQHKKALQRLAKRLG